MKTRKHLRKHIYSMLLVILFTILATGSILAHGDTQQASFESPGQTDP